MRVERIHFDDGTGQIAEAVGTLALREPATSNLNVSVRGLDLLPIEELAGQEDPEFAGLLNGVARITGPAAKPDVLGSFAIERGRYRELQFERIAGAVHYDAGRVGVDVVVEQAPGVTLAVNGSVPLGLFTTQRDTRGRAGRRRIGGTAPIDLRIESSAIGLEVVTGLTTAVKQVGGTANVKLHVTGTADNPLFDGGVTLERRRLHGAGDRAALSRSHDDRPLRAGPPARRRPQDARRGRRRARSVTASSVCVGSPSATSRCTRRRQRFGFVRNDLARLEVDLDLDVTGQVTRPTIAGTAVIEQGRVEVDRVLASLDRGRTPIGPDDGVPIVGEGQRPVAATRAARAVRPRRSRAASAGARRRCRRRDRGRPPVAPRRRRGRGGRRRRGARTELDIRVQIPENLLLRGQDIRRDSAAAGLGDISLVVGGDFRVQKDRRRPTTLVGTVTTVRGSYEYYGRRFEILRDGRIQFQGGTRDRPGARRHGAARHRADRRRGADPRPGDGARADAQLLEHAAARRVGRPRADHLQPRPEQPGRLGAGRRRDDGGHGRRRPGGLTAHRHARPQARARGDRRPDDQRRGRARRRRHRRRSARRRLFVRFRQQFGAQEVSEFLLEYRLAEFMRLQGSVADGDGVGRANRSLTRRVERGGLDLVFYYRY